MFRKCQGFVEKVGAIRFNKVKNRQVNKLNYLTSKERNITDVFTQLTTFSSSQAGRQVSPRTAWLPRKPVQSPLKAVQFLPRQAGRQAGTHLPGDSATSQAVSASSNNSSQ